MRSRAQQNPRHWRYSLRSMGLALLVFGVLCAIGSAYFRRAMKRSFEANTVNPITYTFVSSVGTANGRVMWLRLNATDPHHPNGFDQWIVPISILHMYINDGRVGTYRTFHNSDLEKIVSQHPQLQALDLRTTAVTDRGLRHLSKLKELKWLWLGDAHCSDQGLALLREVSSLESLWLNPDVVSAEALDGLSKSLPNCKVTDARLPDASQERRW